MQRTLVIIKSVLLPFLLIFITPFFFLIGGCAGNENNNEIEMDASSEESCYYWIEQGPIGSGEYSMRIAQTPVKCINGIWGTSSNDIFAAGSDGAILHYDGNKWQMMDSKVETSLYGVWGTDSNNVYVIGNNGELLHYDGKSWRQIDTGESRSLLNIWGYSSKDIK